MEIEIERPSDVTRNLKKFQKKVKDLEGTLKVSNSELLTPEFMHKYSDCSTLGELLITGQLMKEGEKLTQMRFDAIPQESLDRLVSEKTRFTTWDSMKRKAFQEYITRRVMEGLNE